MIPAGLDTKLTAAIQELPPDVVASLTDDRVAVLVVECLDCCWLAGDDMAGCAPELFEALLAAQSELILDRFAQKVGVKCMT